jgi:predicted NAD/FAD-dependent oxidoreductase
VPASASPTAFDGQFWTANVNPTDRYTQALPGTAAFRISPLDAGYDNLTICGDWTDCGYNMGCVEAAVISGRLAAHALSQRPALAEIVGFDHP